MRKGELSSLTGIRFYAALLVYVYHVVLTVPGVNAFSVSSLFSNAADVGVSFFFVLSRRRRASCRRSSAVSS